MLRRNFIKLSSTVLAATLYSRITYATAGGVQLVNDPDEVWAMADGDWFMLKRRGNEFSDKGITIEIKSNSNSKGVYIQSPTADLKGVRLVWKYQTRQYGKVLGDHWERSYGDLGWKAPDADTKKPWYVMLHDDKQTAGFGVKTGCSTICWWGIKPDTIALTLDTQSGGEGVKLGNRKLHGADIVTTMSRAGENAFATTTRFCKMMCERPRLPKQPVYGINDWYFAYGNNSQKFINEFTKAMSEFAASGNKPFSVIDDGWEQADDFSKHNEKFEDMAKMAGEIKVMGMRPGLWTRPLIARLDTPKSRLAPTIKNRDDVKSPILDPSIQENIEQIKHNISLYRQWGYEMVKHDFSSWDIFGRWGMQMGKDLTQPGWHFADQTKTNAEIILNMYRAIRESAGNMYLIGCNTMSHLSAGLFELNRIGDDTSGKEWERTRKMGVNTLAYRLPQNNTFYAADGDCVGITKDVAWHRTKQWLQLVAQSGSPLFISADPSFLNAEHKVAIRRAFAEAAKPQPVGEPLDWMETNQPTKWKLDGKVVTFDWS
ncbi:hypothetical protein FPZ42_10985 [Mucilaginibacter achroorhodeus]|uniref:Alpha-galactosidase n=1 Tax=Mucilaginibacter achroorhodeus TaxID=2599294 RepID=A0A563U498_9SPHI|nr:hypothetical protein [Mucilaginibacter achroorhodeus]TWR26145.1 hypothetical protein FPZ42_10985 [Mucilaginibacter achroorhodeus]